MPAITQDRSVTTALGPIGNPPTVNQQSIGTAPVEVLTANTVNYDVVRRCKILLRSTSGEIGWMTTFAGDAAPAMVTATGAFCSIIDQQMHCEYVNVPANQRLWIVASVAATSVQLTVVTS